MPVHGKTARLRPFVTGLLEVFDTSGLDGTVLVLDDASAHSTRLTAEEIAAEDARVRILHCGRDGDIRHSCRPGVSWALAHGHELVVETTCDLPLDPGALPLLVAAVRSGDIVIDSRSVAGDTVSAPLPVRETTNGVMPTRTEPFTASVSATMHASTRGDGIELARSAAMTEVSSYELPTAYHDREGDRPGPSRAAITCPATLAAPATRARDGWHRVPTRVKAYRVAVASLVVVGAATAVAYPMTMLETSVATLIALLTAVGVATLSFMLHAWRDVESLQETAFADARDTPTLSFSLIVPARREESVLGATLRQLAQQDYPDFEVVVVVGHDDPGTERVARAAIGNDERFRIVVDEHAEKSKPKALNTALPYCHGDVVGVFDAEDIVAAGLLRAVDATFARSGAEVVQGATQLVNHHSSWFSARNVVEYYFWFKSRLHFHSRVGFIPLGGNTVFVRRAWLLAASGWDEACLAEDCDLGARLSARGARTAVAYSAQLATREETPESIAALVRQRTRWSQGFLQVLRKGDWRPLPWRARALAVYTLSFPFLQAATLLLLPVGIGASILLQLPIEFALFSFLPIVPLLAILAVEIAGLESLRAEFGLHVRVRDHLRLVLGAVPYQVLLGVAAARAAWRELRGINDWEKTVHVGAHL